MMKLNHGLLKYYLRPKFQQTSFPQCHVIQCTQRFYGAGKKEVNAPKESYFKADDFKNEILPGLELNPNISQDERRRLSYMFRHGATRKDLIDSDPLAVFLTASAVGLTLVGILGFTIWLRSHSFGNEYRLLGREQEREGVKPVTFLPLVDLTKKPNFDVHLKHPLLLAKHLTDEVWNKCKDKKTLCGAAFNLVINPGVKNPDAGVGVCAPDEESYTVWAPLFDRIIEDYHGYKPTDTHRSDLDESKIKDSNPDPNNKYVLSTRIRVGRNLKDYPLNPAISREDRLKVEKTIAEALEGFKGQLEGSYTSLSNLDDENQAQLVKDHLLFKSGDVNLELAGCAREWPEGRGLFVSDDKKLQVWVNEEDQLRIISMQEGSDFKETFSRLSSAIHGLQDELEFSYNDHLGYISSCPTNLGTSMRASVHIRIPHVTSQPQFKEWAERHNLSIRGIDGEHSEPQDGVYDISNKCRLGVSEVECVENLREAVEQLIQWEKRLE